MELRLFYARSIKRATKEDPMYEKLGIWIVNFLMVAAPVLGAPALWHYYQACRSGRVALESEHWWKLVRYTGMLIASIVICVLHFTLSEWNEQEWLTAIVRLVQLDFLLIACWGLHMYAELRHWQASLAVASSALVGVFGGLVFVIGPLAGI
jgi:hypothetical protein